MWTLSAISQRLISTASAFDGSPFAMAMATPNAPVYLRNSRRPNSFFSVFILSSSNVYLLYKNAGGKAYDQNRIAYLLVF
jgi:hypothetical protein